MSRKEISPKLALELRINFLDLLLATTTGKEVDSRSISRRTQSINSQLNESATQNDTVRRLLASYDQNEPLLRLPPLDDSSLALAEADQLSPAARAVLVLESATEIIQLDKELREIEFLAGEDSAGVTGSKGVFDNAAFSSHTALQPQLEELQGSFAPVESDLNALEKRTEELLRRYNDYISTLSELFISWNSVVTSLEDEVNQLEIMDRSAREFDA